MKCNKASGGDGIPAEVYKHGGTTLVHHLHRIFLKIWDNEEVPQELKDASIVTIFKKGSRTECGNYRGIIPALSRWKDPCESSPESTATSLGKYYPRNTVWFQTRTRHYGHDFLCLSGAGEMQGTRV